MKIVAVIPARLGSKRVKQKNLRQIDGKPLIWYAINAAKNSKSIDEIYVNTESDEIGALAIENGVKYYKRKEELAQDTVTSDEFNYDFMKNVNSDIVVMVNPVAPLVTGKDIDEMVRYYLDNRLDTLIPVRQEKLHAFLEETPVNFNTNDTVQTFCSSKPLNFNPNNKLPMTQNIKPVQICAWTVCIWNTKVFTSQFEEKNHAVFSGKYGLYPVNNLKGIKISDEEDFILAEVLLKNEFRWRVRPVHYDSENINPEYPAMWMSEVKCIENILSMMTAEKKKLNILEWGSGKSTVYFSGILKKLGADFRWHAVENYIPWHMKVDTWLKEKGLNSTTTVHLKNPTCEERKEIQEKSDLTEYVNFSKELNIKYDFILIDARRRVECMTIAAELVAKDGVVVLHDAERPDCLQVMKELYRNGGEFVCENSSPVPGGIQKLWVGRV